MQTTFQAPTVDERKIAVLAHASILLTFVVAMTTGGLGTLVVMLVPLFIWFVYRDRSPYVAFHALQATLYQLGILVLGLLVAAVLGSILALVWVITGLLSIIIVGLLLIPIAIVLSLLVAVILGLWPLAGLAYGLAGAWQVYATDNFRYYWVADWLEARL
jgi:uncharacterized Tic20 family protein